MQNKNTEKSCPKCAERDGGLCSDCINEALGTEADRECTIDVPDSELGRTGPLLKRFQNEAKKHFE